MSGFVARGRIPWDRQGQQESSWAVTPPRRAVPEWLRPTSPPLRSPPLANGGPHVTWHLPTRFFTSPGEWGTHLVPMEPPTCGWRPCLVGPERLFYRPTYQPADQPTLLPFLIGHIKIVNFLLLLLLLFYLYYLRWKSNELIPLRLPSSRKKNSIWFHIEIRIRHWEKTND